MNTKSSRQKDCLKIADWAQSIGLTVTKVEKVEETWELGVRPFLPRVWIKNGIIYYDKWTHPGNLLHDLGHIAVTPSWLRPYLSGDLNWSQSPKALELVDSMCDAGAEKGSLKLQNENALIHGDEQAAIAWSFIAAQACGVDDFLPFEIGFNNSDSSTGEELHDSLSMSAAGTGCYHYGIVSLCRSGMLKNKTDFPKLTKWIQD
jgi:hypothetical protein